MIFVANWLKGNERGFMVIRARNKDDAMIVARNTEPQAEVITIDEVDGALSGVIYNHTIFT